MCGIFATKKNGKIVEYYKSQKARGSEGFGVITIAKNKTFNLRRWTKETEFLTGLAEIEKEGNIFTLVHHRFPTSSKNWISQTHPIKVKYNGFVYFIMHNGVISNDEDLKKEHDKLGIEYDTLITTTVETNMSKWQTLEWNDSNALAIEICRFIEGEVDDLKQVRGSYAFFVVKTDGETVVDVFAGRNSGNPIKINDKSMGSTIGHKDLETGVLFKLEYAKDLIFTPVKNFTDNYSSPSYSTYGYNSYYDSKDYGYKRYEWEDDLEDEYEDEEISGYYHKDADLALAKDYEDYVDSVITDLDIYDQAMELIEEYRYTGNGEKLIEVEHMLTQKQLKLN